MFVVWNSVEASRQCCLYGFGVLESRNLLGTEAQVSRAFELAIGRMVTIADCKCIGRFSSKSIRSRPVLVRLPSVWDSRLLLTCNLTSSKTFLRWSSLWEKLGHLRCSCNFIRKVNSILVKFDFSRHSMNSEPTIFPHVTPYNHTLRCQESSFQRWGFHPGAESCVRRVWRGELYLFRLLTPG